MSAAGNTFLALEWNSARRNPTRAIEARRKGKDVFLIENSIANFFCESENSAMSSRISSFGYRAQQPIEEFPRSFQKLGLIPVDALTVDDVISLLVLFHEFENHLRRIFAVHIDEYDKSRPRFSSRIRAKRGSPRFCSS